MSQSKKGANLSAKNKTNVKIVTKKRSGPKREDAGGEVHHAAVRAVNEVMGDMSWKRPYLSSDTDPEYSAYCRAAMSQFIDPAKGSEAVLVPDNAPNHRAVRRFVSRFPIASGDPGCADGFTLIASPSLSSPICYTGGATLVPPVAPGPISMSGKLEATAANVITGGSFLVEDSDNNKAAVQLQSLTHTDSHQGLFFVNFPSGATDNVIIAIGEDQDGDKNGCSIELFRAQTADPAWTPVTSTEGTTVCAIGPKSTKDTEFYVGNARFDQIAFRVTKATPGTHVIHVKVLCNQSAQSQVGAQAVTDLGRGIATEALAGASGGRLVGLSVLVSNTSADIGNGGTITAARVPRNVSPFLSTATINSRSPLHDFYQGPAKTGSYAWWLPRENSCQTFTDIGEAQEQLANDCYLYCNLTGWGGANGSSVVVTVNYVVEFYIGNQLYEKRLTLPRLPLWDQYMHAMSLAPAATCNPEHTELFKSVLNRAKQFADDAVGHYGKHKALYDGAFKALMSML